MRVNVAFDGKKLFEWEGDADAVASIDEEISRIAKAKDVSPEDLSHTMLYNITNNGGFFKGGRETQMMILTWMLISLPTGHPDRPGRCRDYLEAWDFDFDVGSNGHRVDNGYRFHIDVRASFPHTGTA